MSNANILATIAMILGLCSSLSVVAEEDSTPVYESLDKISVGSLFFSPAERARLDALRSGKTMPTATRARLQPSTRNNRAAGFIVKNDNEARVFKDGEFKPGQPDHEMTFPGDVRIVRNINKTDAPPSDTADIKKDE